MKERAEYRADLNQAARRILAGRYVQKHLKLARKFPRKVGRRIVFKRGYWNVPYDQAETQVIRLVAKIDAGVDFLSMRIPKGPPEERTPRKKKTPGGGFFPDAMFEPENADKPWKKSHKEFVLNKLCAGESAIVIAVHPKIKRTEKAVVRMFQQLMDNEAKAAEKYVATKRRKWRGDIKRFSPFDRMMCFHHRRLGLPRAITAKILQRPEGQIEEAAKEEERRIDLLETTVKFNWMKAIAPVADQLLAHRYLYHCARHPIIPDKEYDAMLQEEFEFGAPRGVLPFLFKATNQACDYPPHIRSLAYYLMFKFMEASGAWAPQKLPYESMNYAVAQNKGAKEALNQWSKSNKKKK